MLLYSPTPSVDWKKIDGSLPANHEQTNGKLKINNLQSGDAGTYRCTGRNEQGVNERDVKVIIEGQ